MLIIRDDDDNMLHDGDEDKLVGAAAGKIANCDALGSTAGRFMVSPAVLRPRPCYGQPRSVLGRSVVSGIVSMAGRTISHLRDVTLCTIWLRFHAS